MRERDRERKREREKVSGERKMDKVKKERNKVRNEDLERNKER